MAPIAGLFLALFPLRLTYIEKQFENLSVKVIKEKNESDKKLQFEIVKRLLIGKILRIVILSEVEGRKFFSISSYS